MLVRFASAPPWARSRPTAAQRRGLNFERKVLSTLAVHAGFLAKPWLVSNGRYRQPDGLLFSPAEGLITIAECKYSHCAESFSQIKGYEQWLEHIFPRNLWSFAALEIVRWFDPFVHFPVKIKQISSIKDAAANSFNVLVWPW